uniref:Uncharacterized protein n=1 Tax=Arundo donax TaxID=35708 RepID=A0A0A9FVI0_ARUDO
MEKGGKLSHDRKKPCQAFFFGSVWKTVEQGVHSEEFSQHTMTGRSHAMHSSSILFGRLWNETVMLGALFVDKHQSENDV